MENFDNIENQQYNPQHLQFIKYTDFSWMDFLFLIIQKISSAEKKIDNSYLS